jgi:prolipoprotein diacylglyceryltransferase
MSCMFTIFNSIKSLNQYPILYKHPRFHLMTFGLFCAVGSFIFALIILAYFAIAGYSLRHPVFLSLVGAICIIMGARLLALVALGRHLITKPMHFLGKTAFFNQGGILGGCFWCLLVMKVERIPLWIALDGLCLAGTCCLFIGRLGCYNYGCCHGRVMTRKAFAVYYTHPDSKVIRLNPELSGAPLVPTQFLMAMFHLLMASAMVIMLACGSPPGLSALIYFISDSLFRIIIQRYRYHEFSGPKHFHTWIAMSFSIIGAGLLILYLAFPPVLPKVYFQFNLGLSQWSTYVTASIMVGLTTFACYGVHGRRIGSIF